MIELSILIPSRNEMFLRETVNDLLKNIRANTEIIVGLDGQLADPPIKQHKDVTVIYHSESIGQRAITKQCARLAKGKYIAKTDSHCAFDEGFDVKMLQGFKDNGDNVVMVPIMRNLWAFNWLCEEGHRRYQSPSGPCRECNKPTEKEIVWIAKTNPQSRSYCFDSEPHFQYFREYMKTAKYKEDVKTGYTESMSLQGSFFMCTKERYFSLDIDDESFGSWGCQGLSVACKFWLSGGRVLVNHNTYYGHMFRTQGSDFGFPYKLSGRQVSRAKKKAKELFFHSKFPGQTLPLSWLVEKFNPRGWTDEDKKNLGLKTKGILYYTDNKLNIRIAKECRNQLKKSGLPITSVSLKPLDFGNNIHYIGKRGYLTMFKQILTGLEAMTEEIVFFCEHDVLYHCSHFEFTPEDKETIYYNENVWFFRVTDKKCVHYEATQLSGLCAYRETLITHYKERIDMIEKDGFSNKMGFEPFSHGRIDWKHKFKVERWKSPSPNVDIKHENNLTKAKWSLEDFRNKKYSKGWTEAETIPDWDMESYVFKRG